MPTIKCVNCDKEFEKTQEYQIVKPTGEIKNGRMVHNIQRGLCLNCFLKLTSNSNNEKNYINER